MKILFVHDYATPLGGAEIGLANLREILGQRGHHVRFFASSAGTDGGPSLADATCFGTLSPWRTLVQTCNPAAYRALRREVAAFRPDLVHVRMFLTQLSPSILSLLRDRPALLDVVWYRPVCPRGTKLLPNGAPCRDVYGAACYRHGCLPLRDWLPLMAQMQWWQRQRGVFDAIIAKSQEVRAQLLAAGVGPVELIWDGVPQRPVRPPLGDPPTVVFAGRLVPEKGVDVLLRALAVVRRDLPAARLIVAGDGPLRRDLERLVDQLGLREAVRWTGQQSPADLEKEFSVGWVQAVPSLWVEPFGLVAAESQVRGTAAVVTNTGGLAEIVVDEETGLHVEAGNVDAWAVALRRLLGDRALAERMGAAARQRGLTHFTKEVYVERVLRLYERLCQAPSLPI